MQLIICALGHGHEDVAYLICLTLRVSFGCSLKFATFVRSQRNGGRGARLGSVRGGAHDE